MLGSMAACRKMQCWRNSFIVLYLDPRRQEGRENGCGLRILNPKAHPFFPKKGIAALIRSHPLQQGYTFYPLSSSATPNEQPFICISL